jgi:hypothetical protein
MPDDESTELPDWLPAVNAIASIVGAFFPPAAPLSAGLQYLDVRRARQIDKLRTMGEAARATYGGTAEKLLDRINGDERLQWMLDTAMDAAARAATHQKAKALGNALGNGALAKDDAQVDEAAQMLRIVADLDPVHVRVLDLLWKITYTEELHVDGVRRPGDDQALPPSIMIPDLARHTRGLSEVGLEGAVAVLQRHGLVGIVPGLGGLGGWYTTNVGNAVLRFVRGAGTA